MITFPITYIKPIYAAATTVAVTNALTGSNTTIASLHDTFSVNVSLENVPQELEGYEFTLVWNASILNCTNYTVTPPREWGNNTFISRDQLNRTNPDGTQSYYTVVETTFFGVNVGPNHVVNTLNFTVIGTGETALALGDVMLADPYGHIPVTVVSGLFKTLVGTIYIQADGSITPSMANITTSDNVTYAFTGNNCLPIVVNRSNVVINGNGFTVQSRKTGDGFSLSKIGNVTIRNTTVTDCLVGIDVNSYSNDNTFSDNNVSANVGDGIFLNSSSNNVLSHNTVAANHHGIHLGILSFLNIISNNNVTSNLYDGIELGQYCNMNDISGNNVIANCQNGIELRYGLSNTFTSNNITATNSNEYGFVLVGTFGNVLSDNVVATNYGSILMENSSSNKIYDNTFESKTVQVEGGFGSNTWDNGYPSGGNYWSDYQTKNPYATENDSTGIWNAPYWIDSSNVDNYPLVHPVIVIPEFQPFMLLPLFMIATLLVVAIYRRKKT